jgi:hypothetical protein
MGQPMHGVLGCLASSSILSDVGHQVQKKLFADLRV